MAIAAAAWLESGTAAGVAIMGLAATAVRRWARSMHEDATEIAASVMARLDATDARVDDLEDLALVRGERLASVETAVFGVPRVHIDPAHPTTPRRRRLTKEDP